MRSFDAARRDMLRLSSLGLAATMPTAAFGQSTGLDPKQTILFDIRTYGAVGDGKTLATTAINAAIEAAAASGGGTVYLPAGVFLSFSVCLKSNVSLYLAQGSVLRAADSPLPGQTTGYNGGTYDAAEPFSRHPISK